MKQRLAQLLRQFWTWLSRPWRREVRYRVVSVADLPDHPRAHHLYVFGDPQQPWSVALLCPCGCGELLHLSLLAADWPRWRLVGQGRPPTLVPSVWRTDGCRAHFILRDGAIRWCGGEPPDG